MGFCLNHAMNIWLQIKFRHYIIQTQESRIMNQESRIMNQESRIKSQESTVHRQGSQAWPHSLASRPLIRDGLSSRTLIGSGLRNRHLVKAFLITSSQYTSQSFHQTRARNSATSKRTNMGPTWKSCLYIYFRLIYLIKKKAIQVII